MEQETPNIPYSLCMDLIAELELKRGGAMLRSACVSPVTVAPSATSVGDVEGNKFLDHLRRMVERLFPELPSDLKARVVPSSTHLPAASGLNRHCRRQLERGGAMIHLFSSKQAWDHPKGPPTLSV